MSLLMSWLVPKESQTTAFDVNKYTEDPSEMEASLILVLHFLSPHTAHRHIDNDSLKNNEFHKHFS